MSGILGAIIAGGRSRRFGSDKALAEYRGMRLIDHVAARLRPQVDALVLCGRAMAGWTGIADRPAAGLGPLAGVNAALHHARASGFAAVVTVPCDSPALPADLVERLRSHGSAAYLVDLPVVALWPVSFADALDRHLRSPGDRSMRGAAALLGAVAVPLAVANVNTPADLRALASTAHAGGDSSAGP